MRAAGEATRQRILEAAAEEFALHGIAGARVNRIAETARASKERLYAYFGDKERLFDEVIAHELDEIADEVPIGEDLPDYAGRLYDHLLSAPERHRMAVWAWLQEPATRLPEGHPRLAAYAEKVAVVRAAQASGHADPRWDPFDLLALLFGLAAAWSSAPRELHQLAADATPSRTAADRRAAVVEAARRVVQRSS